MEPWHVGLAATLLLGLAVLLFGHLNDRRRNARRAAVEHATPRRPIPGYDASAGGPRYLSAAEAGRRVPRASLTQPERLRVERQLTTAVTAPLGLPSADFVTDDASGRAIMPAATVLLTEARIANLRMILTALERCRAAGRPLVLIADGYADPVLRTLAANVAQNLLSVLPLTADQAQRQELSRDLGLTVVSAADLQAGYLPESSLTPVALWVTDQARSRVVVAEAGSAQA